MPLSFRASELTDASGPVPKYTGLRGAASSSSARVGKRWSFSRVMNTCDSVIHSPGLVTAGAPADVLQHVRDGLHVGHRVIELVHRRVGGVHVGVDQSGQHRLALQVDLARLRTGQLADLGVGAHRHNAVAPHGHRAGDAEALVHRDDLPVLQDHVGRLRERRRGTN